MFGLHGCTPRTLRHHPTHNTPGARHLGRGYTLHELMVTLAIAGSLGTLAAGAGNLIERNRLVAITNTLVGHLHLARSEAVTRGMRITLCQSPDGRACGRSDQWERGWLLFVDNNRNRRIDRNEKIVYTHASLAPGYTLRWRGSMGSNYYLSFKPNGGTNKVGTFSLCGPDGASQARTVIVFRSGRVRTSTRKPGGKPPDCPGA